MTKPSVEIPTERLFEVFNVDFELGLLFWKIKSAKQIKIGKGLGWKNANGYLMVGLDYKQTMVHRIIWAMKYGVWPKNQIDHINGNKTDNRIKNLREVTNAQNCANRKKSSILSKTGIRGVFFDKNRKKFRAQITKNGKSTHLGMFMTVEDACAAYIAASQQLHGEYSPFSN